MKGKKPASAFRAGWPAVFGVIVVIAAAVVIGVSKPVVFGIGAWLKRHATKHFEP